MKKILIVLILMGLLALPPESVAGEIERIQAKGQLVVSLNKGYPPFAMQTDGQLSGLDIDLANLLAKYLGVDVKFIQPDTYDQQIPKLLAGESDIIIAAMTRTVARGLKVNFTIPYFEVSQAGLVRRKLVPENANSYFDLTDIPKLRLGVKANTTHEAFARELFPAEVIKTFPTAAEAAEALVKGDLDAMVADSPFIKIWWNTHPQHYAKFKALLEPVTRETYGFAIRKGDPEFLNWLNLFIEHIKADGTMDLLIHDYFVRMAWAGRPMSPQTKLNRATLLKNKFLIQKKAMIEQQRAALRGTGDAYE